MTEYTSKQVHINKPDSMIYEALSRFDNFTPILKDKVENWQANENTCSFKAKGFDLKLKMEEKEPCKLIKISGDNMPFELFLWIQLKQVDSSDTRMRIVIKAKLNTMMKMMIGKKLQKAVDQIAEQIAAGFNAG